MNRKLFFDREKQERIDLFAGKAMAALCVDGGTGTKRVKYVASLAYDLAEALEADRANRFVKRQDELPPLNRDN